MAGSVFVHPMGLNDSACVGDGTRVWAYAHVMEGARIGENCNIGEHCFVESGAVLGNGVTLKNGVCVWDGIEIEDFAFIGPLVALTNDRFPRSPRLDSAAVQKRYAHGEWLVKTRIGRGAAIGANATIVCGISIGEFATIAAGAVVTQTVGAYQLVAGNPARAIGVVCQCGQKVVVEGQTAQCLTCGASYGQTDGAWHPAGIV